VWELLDQRSRVFRPGHPEPDADQLPRIASANPRPWRIEIPKAIVCHVPPDNPRGKQKNLAVGFPDDLAIHLDHGDTLGLCQTGD